MDDRQFEAAQRAVNKLKMDNIVKKYALLQRDDCISECQKYHLPYRCLYRLHADPQGRVLPNDYYPQPGASPILQEARGTLEALQKSSLQSARATIRRLTSISEDTKARMIEEAKQTFQQSAEQVASQIREMEELELLQVSRYDYYFTCFLADEDFDSYKAYDWTGNVISAEQADTLREGYEARQRAYRAHPEQFAGFYYVKDIKRPEGTELPPVPEF